MVPEGKALGLEAASGRHLWTERFTLERNELAAWQDEIVGRIASTLNFRLARVETERTLRERRDSIRFVPCFDET